MAGDRHLGDWKLRLCNSGGSFSIKDVDIVPLLVGDGRAASVDADNRRLHFIALGPYGFPAGVNIGRAVFRIFYHVVAEQLKIYKAAFADSRFPVFTRRAGPVGIPHGFLPVHRVLRILVLLLVPVPAIAQGSEKQRCHCKN